MASVNEAHLSLIAADLESEMKQAHVLNHQPSDDYDWDEELSKVTHRTPLQHALGNAAGRLSFYVSRLMDLEPTIEDLFYFQPPPLNQGLLEEIGVGENMDQSPSDCIARNLDTPPDFRRNMRDGPAHSTNKNPEVPKVTDEFEGNLIQSSCSTLNSIEEDIILASPPPLMENDTSAIVDCEMTDNWEETNENFDTRTAFLEHEGFVKKASSKELKAPALLPA